MDTLLEAHELSFIFERLFGVEGATAIFNFIFGLGGFYAFALVVPIVYVHFWILLAEDVEGRLLSPSTIGPSGLNFITFVILFICASLLYGQFLANRCLFKSDDFWPLLTDFKS